MLLANQIISAAHAGGGLLYPDFIRETANILPTAGRFEVDRQVMTAVGRMERTPTDQLLSVLNLARPPFPTTWIEWPDEDGGRLGSPR